MQAETIEAADTDDEGRIIGSDGSAADRLKAAIDARWEQSSSE